MNTLNQTVELPTTPPCQAIKYTVPGIPRGFTAEVGPGSSVTEKLKARGRKDVFIPWEPRAAKVIKNRPHGYNAR